MTGGRHETTRRPSPDFLYDENDIRGVHRASKMFRSDSPAFGFVKNYSKSLSIAQLERIPPGRRKDCTDPLELSKHSHDRADKRGKIK